MSALIRHLGLLSLLLGLLGASSCSVDEFRNLARKNREECESAGGRPITDKFCLIGPRDAAADGATYDDADGGETNADAATSDAGTPCSGEGKSELCYDAEDQSTARQMPCRAGTRTCHDGHFGRCEDQVLPEAEGCDGLDNDCDGRVDESLTASDCEVEAVQGACRDGVRVCSHGEYKCLQVTHPQSDSCNGEDDDCDGKTDEETALNCYDPVAAGCSKDSDGEYTCVGTCRSGTSACEGGKYQEDCAGTVTPAAADSCTQSGENTGDEDCDGQFDEGCACSAGNTCYTGSPAETKTRAPCHAGTQACSDATHGTCTNEVTPQPESCANTGVDDDCDGEVDNILLDGASCTARSTGKGACKAGATWQCTDGVQTCVDAPTAAERCDGQGVDEDCDGRVDEGFMLATDGNNCGACGVTCGGSLRCCAGHCVNTTVSNDHCSSCNTRCTGQTCCSSSCADTTSDPNNCGTCGHVCSGLLKGCTKGVCTKLLL